MPHSFTTIQPNDTVTSAWGNEVQDTIQSVHDTVFLAAEYDTIQDAIEAANTAGGGTVLIGPGTHDAELTIYDHIHLVGSGIEATILRLPDGTNGSAVITSEDFATRTGTSTNDGTRWFSISNLKIDGNRANNTAGLGIQIYGYDYRMHQLWIIGAPEEGFWSEFGGVAPNISQGPYINACKIGLCGASGFRWKGPTDGRIHQLVCYRNNQADVGGSGIWLDTGSAVAELSMCYAWGITHDYGIRINGASIELNQCNASSASIAEVYIGSAANNCRIHGGLLVQSNVNSLVALEIDTASSGHVIHTKTRDHADVTLIKWSGAQTSSYADIKISDKGASGIIESGNRPYNAKVEVVSDTIGLSLPVVGQSEHWDDFVSGNPANGNVGNLGWNLAGGGVNSMLPMEAGRPGIFRRGTGATSGTYAVLRSASVDGPVLPAEMWDLLWIVRTNDNDSNTTVRIGMGNDSSADPPDNGIYFEKLAADTNWFVVTRASATETRTDTGVAVGTAAFSRFRIRRLDASTIGFTLDSGTEIEHTANIPTAALNPLTAVGNNAASVNKTVDHDAYNIRFTGLAR